LLTGGSFVEDIVEVSLAIVSGEAGFGLTRLGRGDVMGESGCGDGVDIAVS
jgi:hypothetical protein